MSDVSDTAPTLNKQYIRAAVLVGFLGLVVMATKKDEDARVIKYQHELILIHLLSFASWFGCSVWVSFISGIIMFKNLPRHVFGRLQAKLFPAYFLFSAVLICMAMATASALGWSILSLSTILVTILVNLLYFEPQTTKIMFQRHVVERRLGTGHEVGILKPKDPEKANDTELKKLSKQFGMLHGMSTMINLGALVMGCYWLNFCTQRMLE